MKVWLIEQGSYSDYRILAVVDSVETAQACVEAGFGEEYTEHEILTEVPVRINGASCWTDIAANGDVKGIGGYAPGELQVNQTFDHGLGKELYPHRPSTTVRPWGDVKRVQTRGRDVDAVQKAHADAVAKVRAEVMGL